MLEAVERAEKILSELESQQDEVCVCACTSEVGPKQGFGTMSARRMPAVADDRHSANMKAP